MIDMKKFVRWFWGVFKNTFILIVNILKSMWTIRGIIAFLMSVLIWVGWAVVFVILGLIYNAPKLYTIGMGVIVFYSGPFPMWVFITACAWLIQRFILFDVDAMSWKEFKALIKELFPDFYAWCIKIKEKRKEEDKYVLKIRVFPFINYKFKIK